MRVTNNFPPPSHQPLSNRLDVASSFLLHGYFHGKRSDKKHFLIPPSVTFGARNQNATFIVANQIAVKSYFYSNRFFARTLSLWNELPRGYLSDYYNLYLFKSSYNRCLPTYTYKIPLNKYTTTNDIWSCTG